MGKNWNKQNGCGDDGGNGDYDGDGDGDGGDDNGDGVVCTKHQVPVPKTKYQVPE